MTDERGRGIDPELPVVRLCVAGMQAEADGRAEAAYEFFRQAWNAAGDDYEACIAAHYLARQQSSPEETLRWNQECLDRADRVADERVQAFYPSLYLNMGRAYQELGQSALAHQHFVRAAERVGELPDGQYGDWNRFAIAEGLRNTAAEAPTGGTVAGSAAPLAPAIDTSIRELQSRWCARGDLMALGLTLPAFLGYLGTDEDRLRLRTALHMLHAARRLPQDEQTALGALLGAAALG
ncbi:hypothetical protein [Streptomyces natalensis]|uniref:Tetratricopeptide repeat protein n=1 Tax=Streptomyces natalensis ATCC 27448 TaxID=1240678 RepID=A0A0D7CVE4_9ACTN|nr:hypothetical protein [Streptomyces natalensis]KIZ19357.1 hypothetical protein SNA_02200 [Streptomyces natalensis ATCC 27448]